jgi:hypothetical protein
MVLRACKRGIELVSVEPRGSVRSPLDSPRSHVEEAIRARERAFQVVKDVTEIGARLWLTRVRPELECEVLAAQGGVAIQEQVGKQ